VVGAQVLGPKVSSSAAATEFTRDATNIDQQAGTPALAAWNLIIPPSPLDGANLIAASDLVISAGGTINREAAALGVPVASVYAGKWAAVDEELVKEGRLKRLSKVQDIETLVIAKKQNMNPRRSRAVIDEVVSLILE
jgi:predicted glycosyltransferase